MPRTKYDQDRWLTCDELALLEGVSRCAIAWRCRNGYYSRLRKVKSAGRAGGIKGESWLISLYDTKITRIVRHRYHLKNLILTEAKTLVNESLETILARLDDIGKNLIDLRGDLG